MMRVLVLLLLFAPSVFAAGEFSAGDGIELSRFCEFDNSCVRQAATCVHICGALANERDCMALCTDGELSIDPDKYERLCTSRKIGADQCSDIVACTKSCDLRDPDWCFGSCLFDLYQDFLMFKYMCVESCNDNKQQCYEKCNVNRKEQQMFTDETYCNEQCISCEETCAVFAGVDAQQNPEINDIDEINPIVTTPNLPEEEPVTPAGDEGWSYEFWAMLGTLLAVGLSVGGFITSKMHRKEAVSILDKIEVAYEQHRYQSDYCILELMELRKQLMQEFKDGKLDDTNFEFILQKVDSYIDNLKHYN